MVSAAAAAAAAAACGQLSERPAHPSACLIERVLRSLHVVGTLVALERPAGYVERREDGYQEPLQVFLVGTAHVRSAADALLGGVTRWRLIGCKHMHQQLPWRAQR